MRLVRLPVLSDEPPSEWTGIDGVTWRRTGYCCRCGECCKGDPFADSGAEFCPLFAREPGGAGRCTDRAHPYYLSGCNVWPQVPAQIADKPACTYRFERVHGG